MKRAVPWLIAVGCAGLSIGLLLQGSRSSRAVVAATNSLGQPAPMPAPALTGPVVHTFEDNVAMQDFAVRWQQRQVILTRMALLQAYWNNEQAALAKLVEQMKTAFGLDATKNYFLNGERKVLIEQTAPAPASEAAASSDAATPGDAAALAQPSAAQAEERVAYTFQSDEEMKSFAEQWQQRQIIALRMGVLQSYWNQEQATVAAINDKLREDYQIDPSKQYMLDGQHRRLIERETPPPTQDAVEIGDSH